MPYTCETTLQDRDRVLKFGLRKDGLPISWSSVIELWQGDEQFRAYFTSLLAAAPFAAYFWETPPLINATLGDEFEFVLVNSDQLASVTADPQAFAKYFDGAERGASVVSFENLGGDAILIAPCPGEPLSAYSQIASFSREASCQQQHEFWKLVGATLEKRVGKDPVWVNTSGLGVYWLHVRLDRAPKYYTHQPYRRLQKALVQAR